MTTREYEFTVGPETSDQPTVGTPTDPDDNLTLGFADGRYTQGSESVADIAAVKAIAAADRRDGDLIAVQATNVLYIFDAGSSATGDDNFVLTPDAGTGRWLKASSTAGEPISAGGTGEINYIDEPDAETAISAWATYADAAGSEPVDGDGGSPTVTWTRTTDVILRGTQSYKLTKPASNVQGEGVAIPFTIKEQDTNKLCKIECDFKTDEDVGFARGDLGVFVYDVTNATLITPEGDVDFNRETNTFAISWLSTDSFSYRLILHVRTTNALAWDAYFDRFIVNGGSVNQGAAIGASGRYTPVIGDFGNASGLTVDIESNIDYQRVGDRLRLHYTFRFDGTGTDIGTFGFFLGTWLSNELGVTIDYAKSQQWTAANLFKNGTGGHQVIGAYNNSGNLNWVSDNESGSAIDGDVVGDAPGRFETFTGYLDLAIVDWAGKGVVNLLAEDNLSEWQAYTPNNTQGFGTISSSNLEWRKVGEEMEIRGDFTAGTVTASEAQLGLPANKTISGVSTGAVRAGTIDRDGSTGTRVIALATKNDTFINFGREDGTQNVTSPVNASTVFSSSVRYTVQIKVPIAEFAGSQNSLVGFSIADSVNAGLFPAVTNMSDALATQLGHKVYRATTDFTVTGSTSLTSYDCEIIPKQMSDGTWVCDLWFHGTSAATTAINFTFSGIDFDWNGDLGVSSESEQAVYFWGPDGITESGTHLLGGGSAVNVIRYLGSSRTEWKFSGKLKLASKPTWAT